MSEKKHCNYTEAWKGECTNPPIKGMDYCSWHINIFCVACGKQATHQCDEMSSMVCGTPLCDSRECKINHMCVRIR